MNCRFFGLKTRTLYAMVFIILLPFALFAAGPRDLEFGGMLWGLRQTAGPVDPGPNTFSNAEEQVWVDEKGRAHLTLQKRQDTWFASEMMAKKDAGYGTYRFTASSSLKDLDPNIVFGFFTWDRNPGVFNREIDIEISRWGDKDGRDGWFTVQPYDVPGNQYSFLLPQADSYTFELKWEKNRIEYSLIAGGVIQETWTYTKTVPDPGRARLRINLWLFRGKPPAGPGPYEVIISDYTFTPSQ